MGKAEQKIIPHRYQVVPRTLCFITHGNDVLLLHGASDKRIWADKVNGVGGHIEAHEDVYTAARREIEEETGLEVRDLRLCGVINIPVKAEENQTGILLFVFSGEAHTRDVRHSNEGRLEWVSQDELDALPLVEDLPIIVPKALSMGERDAPFYALYEYDEDDQLIITFA